MNARYDKAMWVVTLVALVLVFGSPFVAMWGLLGWGLAVKLIVTGVVGWLVAVILVAAVFDPRNKS